MFRPTDEVRDTEHVEPLDVLIEKWQPVNEKQENRRFTRCHVSKQ